QVLQLRRRRQNLFHENERTARHGMFENGFDDSLAIFDGRELNGEHRERYARRLYRIIGPQVEVANVDEPLRDRFREPLTRRRKHGRTDLDPDEPVGGAKLADEWRQRLTARATEVHDRGVWLDELRPEVEDRLPHHVVLRNGPGQHVVEDLGDRPV